MEKMLKYLRELELNNNREWFAATKSERKLVTLEFEELIQTLIYRIGEEDPSILDNDPRELTFKMVRDTRFSLDKSPYNPCLRAHISSKGKLPIPVGYYISIKPNDQSFLGGGLFADMFQNATTMLRDYIVEHGQELIAILEDQNFKKHFKMNGTVLQRVPSGYDPKSPYADFLKYKCMYLEYPLKDQDLLEADFIEKATEIFLAMKPFNDFLNNALRGFEMPPRP